MTTMDSDSESQDSDDGRRFRFEATRKDSNAQAETRDRLRTVTSKSKHKSRHNDVDYKDKKERSKYESARKEYRSSKDRDTDGKDLRHTVKYSKHAYESRSSKHEDNKDYRDASESSRSSDAQLSKKKARDSKHHRNRDRNEHCRHRSQERSRNRSEDKSLSEKHEKSHERHKRHSRERGLHKVKPTEYSRSRNEHERHDTHKRTIKETENQHSKEYSSPKTEQDRNEKEQPPSISPREICERGVSVDSQECKYLDLSEFDILSETDENLSDSSDIKSQSSVQLQRQYKTKVKKRNSNGNYENSGKKRATESKHLEECKKVNAKKDDPLSGSSNNNPSAISDSIIGSASSNASAIVEDCTNDVTKRLKCKSEQIDTVSSNCESSNFLEDTSLHFNNHSSSREILQSEQVSASIAENDSTYGPTLPSQLPVKCTVTSDQEPSLCSSEHKDMKSAKGFIGPCLPPKHVQESTEKSNDTVDSRSSVDANGSNPGTSNQNSTPEEVFGPALPPHLLQHKSSDTREKVIGPALPGPMKSSNDVENVTRDSDEDEDEDEDEAIGPLPIGHPALKSNFVHKQLEQRAQRIKAEQQLEDDSTANQREEWMTELPPAQASNLGLGPRKFRVRAAPDMSDRSCWTDTPAKKAEKQRQRDEAKALSLKSPDTEHAKKTVDVEPDRSRKREKSLLDIHQEKLRKKKKKEEKEAKVTGQKTRRPFDRDIDLKANQFDQAQKNTILKKAQLLEDRFSRGKI